MRCLFVPVLSVSQGSSYTSRSMALLLSQIVDLRGRPSSSMPNPRLFCLECQGKVHTSGDSHARFKPASRAMGPPLRRLTAECLVVLAFHLLSCRSSYCDCRLRLDCIDEGHDSRSLRNPLERPAVCESSPAAVPDLAKKWMPLTLMNNLRALDTGNDTMVAYEYALASYGSRGLPRAVLHPRERA